MLMIWGSERVDPVRVLVGDNFVPSFRSANGFFNPFAVANQALEFPLFHRAKRFGDLAPEAKRHNCHREGRDAQYFLDRGSLHEQSTLGHNDRNHGERTKNWHEHHETQLPSSRAFHGSGST